MPLTGSHPVATLCSPDEQLVLVVGLDDRGVPFYEVVRHGPAGGQVLLPSRLGIRRDDADFTTGLVHDANVGPEPVVQTYQLTSGKQRRVESEGREVVVRFRNAQDRRIDLVLRAYDDAVAFRYRFPGLSDRPHRIVGERTGFALPPGRSWLQPYDFPGWATPAHEAYYSNGTPTGLRMPVAGFTFPALFEARGQWTLITEAGVDGSTAGSHLGADPIGGEYLIEPALATDANGHFSNEVVAQLPWAGPWRVVITHPDPGRVISATAVTDHAAPRALEDTSWIQPGRVAWSWWSDHRSPRNPETQRRYIELAADMGWEYCLIDANWDQLDDAVLADLVAYARDRGVGMLLWYNSGGSTNSVTEAPRDRMDDPAVRRAEMAKLASWGASGIKVDFFHSDKQEMMRRYLGILEDAAAARLVVSFHGCTVPRGWERTWPNLLTMEAVRGAEQYWFDPLYTERAPELNTILPFTRNAVGSMDYTPVTFSHVRFPHTTTHAHELALSVVFESGLQHLADSEQSYRALPSHALDILRDLPVVWDELVLVGGTPGSHVALARRHGAEWWVGAVNGTDEELTVTLDPDRLGIVGARLRRLSDGVGGADLTVDDLTAEGPVALPLAPRGGCLLRPLG